jgi:hypothetical protein
MRYKEDFEDIEFPSCSMPDDDGSNLKKSNKKENSKDKRKIILIATILVIAIIIIIIVLIASLKKKKNGKNITDPIPPIIVPAPQVKNSFKVKIFDVKDKKEGIICLILQLLVIIIK